MGQLQFYPDIVNMFLIAFLVFAEFAFNYASTDSCISGGKTNHWLKEVPGKKLIAEMRADNIEKNLKYVCYVN